MKNEEGKESEKSQKGKKQVSSCRARRRGEPPASPRLNSFHPPTFSFFCLHLPLHSLDTSQNKRGEEEQMKMRRGRETIFFVGSERASERESRPLFFSVLSLVSNSSSLSSFFCLHLSLHSLGISQTRKDGASGGEAEQTVEDGRREK